MKPLRWSVFLCWSPALRYEATSENWKPFQNDEKYFLFQILNFEFILFRILAASDYIIVYAISQRFTVPVSYNYDVLWYNYKALKQNSDFQISFKTFRGIHRKWAEDGRLLLSTTFTARSELLFCFKVGLSLSKKFVFIYFNESPLKLINNALYFMLKALFAIEIFTFL